MNVQLIVVAGCVLAAIVFMGFKVVKTLKGRAKCSCDTCTDGKGCQNCQAVSLRDFRKQG